MNWKQIPLRWLLAAVVIVAGSAYLLWCWYAPAPPILSSAYMAAQPAHAVAKTATVPVKLEVPLQVVPKTLASKKLKLPREVADDDEKHVIATADIPATKGGATTVTVLDARTGKSETLVKEKPRPLVSFERGTEVGARYGVSTDGGQEATIYARRDLLRVGSVYLAGYADASIDAKGDSAARAMIDVSMRW